MRTSETLTAITCDRCGETLTDITQWPKGWRTVTSGSSALSNRYVFTGHEPLNRDLCHACGDEFLAWLLVDDESPDGVDDVTA